MRDAVCDSLMTRQLVARRGPWVHSQPRRTARRRARRTCASRPPCAARRVSFPFRQPSGRAECGPVRRSLRTIAKPVVHHALLLCCRRCCDVDASESVCAATNDAQPRVARRNQDMMCVWRTGERAAIRRSARTRRCAAWCVTRSRHSCLLHAAVRGYAHRRGAQPVDERAGRRRLAHTPCARHASFPSRQDCDRSAYGPVRRSMRKIVASRARVATAAATAAATGYATTRSVTMLRRRQGGLCICSLRCTRLLRLLRALPCLQYARAPRRCGAPPHHVDERNIVLGSMPCRGRATTVEPCRGPTDNTRAAG